MHDVRDREENQGGIDDFQIEKKFDLLLIRSPFSIHLKEMKR
jgi:hypothetical protein